MRMKGFRGAFTRLMKEHPDVEQLILTLHRQRGRRMPIPEIHQKMLRALHAKGLQSSDYPFNTVTGGVSGLRCYLKKSDDVVCVL